MKIVEITNFSEKEFITVQKLVKILTNDNTNLSKDLYIQIIEDSNSHLFLAYEEEDIVGMITVGTYKSPTNSKAWIEDVVIDDRYQGKGLGKKMLVQALEFIKLLDIGVIMLTSNPSRIAANKLYQKMGFENKDTNVYLMKLK